ncbi:hypothetical protein HYZ82_02990 [Candidatus Nomurabacteria bacterium]|nr:hypothetical protein [Candidatus Nomurabacteria bacterium]
MAKTISSLFVILGVAIATEAILLGQRSGNPMPPPVTVPDQNATSREEEPNTSEDTQTKRPTPSVTTNPAVPGPTPTMPIPNIPADPSPVAPTISAVSVCNTALINPDGFDSMRVNLESCVRPGK